MQPSCEADDAARLTPGMLPYIQTQAASRLVPFNAFIELTLGCNIRCRHCYNFDRDTPLPAELRGGNVLSPDEIKDVIRQLRAEGTLFLFLTGGEALLHPHFFEFVALAGELNMAVHLLSNGVLIDEAMVARFRQYPHFQGVSLSLYGASAAVHDDITQAPGSFEKTVRAAELLKAAAIRVSLKYIVMKSNVHETGDAMRHFGGRGFVMHPDFGITGRHNHDAGSLATRISNEQAAELFRGPLRDLLPPPRPEESAGKGWRCNCAQGNCAITATGEVQPCISVPLSGGNVRQRPFAEIWRHSPVFEWIRGLGSRDFPVCSACDVRPYCVRAPGGALLATGSYTGVDPWVCRNAETVCEIMTGERRLAAVPAGTI